MKYSFKKVFQSALFFLTVSIMFSSFSHAAAGRNSPIPDRTNVPGDNYLIIIISLGVLYTVFLFLRARRRKKTRQIVLKYTR